jgi:hypothetical protein
MYRDHAVSPTVFHWESQHTAHAGTPAGKRYSKGTSRVLLFVREHQKLPNGLAEPFVFLGPATFRSGKGERPMQIEWKLAEPMPEWLYGRRRCWRGEGGATHPSGVAPASL